jgi:hypothetical protein
MADFDKIVTLVQSLHAVSVAVDSTSGEQLDSAHAKLWRERLLKKYGSYLLAIALKAEQPQPVAPCAQFNLEIKTAFDGSFFVEDVRGSMFVLDLCIKIQEKTEITPLQQRPSYVGWIDYHKKLAELGIDGSKPVYITYDP